MNAPPSQQAHDDQAAAAEHDAGRVVARLARLLGASLEPRAMHELPSWVLAKIGAHHVANLERRGQVCEHLLPPRMRPAVAAAEQATQGPQVSVFAAWLPGVTVCVNCAHELAAIDAEITCARCDTPDNPSASELDIVAVQLGLVITLYATCPTCPNTPATT